MKGSAFRPARYQAYNKNMRLGTHDREPLARVLLLALLASILAACATPRAPQTAPVFMHHGPAATVPDVDVLQLTPEMQSFLNRYVLIYENRDVRLDLLTRSVLDSAVQGFHYVDGLTLTAAQAFEQRSGNCVAFANLMVALGRAAGLQVDFQEVTLAPEWSSEEDTLVVSRHINVLLTGPGRGVVADTSGVARQRWQRRKTLDDAHALGLYYTNLGADALFEGDLSRAYALLVKATRVAPGLADPWVNLGVVYGRNGQMDAAVMAYEVALEMDPDQVSALSNLYAVYEAHEAEAELARLAPRVEAYRQRNPYHLMKKAELALEEGQFEEAQRLIGRAIAIKDSEPLFHYTQARVFYLAGHFGNAQESLDQARERAQGELLSAYTHPLSALADP